MRHNVFVPGKIFGASLKLSLLCGAGAVASLSGGMAHAQDGAAASEGSSSNLPNIVVTAQKRETDLQETPIAITVVDGKALAERDITSVQALSFSTPGLVYAEAVSQQQISIRGIGSDIPNISGEPGVAFHIDGVYMGALNDSTSIFGELERVEVLRGPQGTLYGRNATGGAINLVTKRPSLTPEGYLSVLYGNYDRIEVRAGASGPLGEKVAARLSYYFEDRDGYAFNVTTGQNTDNNNRHAVRGSLLFEPTDQLEIVLRADYGKDDYTGMPNKPLDIGDPNAGFKEIQDLGPEVGRYARDPRIIFSEFPNRSEREIWGVSGSAEYDAGGVVFRSITAFRDADMPLSTDSDGFEVFSPESGGIHIINTVSARQISQEFQLLSENDGAINWLLGAFYYDQVANLGIDADIAIPGGSFPFVVDTRQETESYAGFGELYFNLSDQLKVTLGARYTSDKRSFTNTFDLGNSETFTQFTPKIGIEYVFSDDVFGYATFSRGFKSGGFNIFDFSPNPLPFEPEKVDAFEAGIKTDLLNRHLRFNASAFYYDYTDMQVTQFPGDGTQFVNNAASSRIYGADLQLVALPTDWLTLEATTSFLNARFREFETADLLDPTGPVRDLSGNRLVRAPDFVGNFAAEAEIPVGLSSLTFRGEVAHSSSYFFTVFNREPAKQDAYTMLHGFISYETPDEMWKFSIFGRNLTDEDVLASAFETPKVGTFLAPRTYGVSVTRQF